MQPLYTNKTKNNPHRQTTKKPMTLNEEITWCKQHIKKGYEVIALRSILQRLQKLAKEKTPPHPCHNQSAKAYKDFLAQHGLPPIVEPRQAKALKELLPKLQNATTSKTTEAAYKALLFIFNNWTRLNNFHQKQKTLTHLNTHLIEILDQIRNGSTKQQAHLNEAERFRNELTKK